MLIVIAGLIGAGKTTIAREVSKRLNIPSYSIDEDKKRIYKQYPAYEHHMANNIPFPDELWKKTADVSLEGLRQLSKNNKHVIVEETFRRKSLREPFFEEAAKLFGGMILTLVTVDESLVKERMDKRAKEENHMVGYGMYLSTKKYFEPFDHVDYTFVNEGNYEENVEKYVKFLKERLLL